MNKAVPLRALLAAGTHGWYRQNPGPATAVIKLKTSGFYSELKKM